MGVDGCARIIITIEFKIVVWLEVVGVVIISFRRCNIGRRVGA